MEKITLESLSIKDIREYIEKMEQQQNELNSRIAKANRILLTKSINDVATNRKED